MDYQILETTIKFLNDTNNSGTLPAITGDSSLYLIMIVFAFLMLALLSLMFVVKRNKKQISNKLFAIPIALFVLCGCTGIFTITNNTNEKAFANNEITMPTIINAYVSSEGNINFEKATISSTMDNNLIFSNIEASLCDGISDLSNVTWSININDNNIYNSPIPGSNQFKLETSNSATLNISVNNLNIQTAKSLISKDVCKLKIYVKNADEPVPGNSWMSKVDDNLVINNINIPGTHDSGTNKIDDPKYDPEFKTQCMYIDEQLNCGVRLFDLRLGYNEEAPGNLALCHTTHWCYDRNSKIVSYSGSVLSDIKQFLIENPTETVLIAPRFEDGDDTKYAENMQLWWNNAQYEKTIDGRPLFYVDQKIPSLSEVRGRIVLLARGSFHTSGTCEEWKVTSEKLGIKIRCMDDQEVQDENFDVENHWDAEIHAKLNYVLAHIDRSAAIDRSSSKIRICFTSGNNDTEGPKEFGELINPTICNKTLSSGKQYGWWFVDFANYEVPESHSEYIPVQKLYMTNF